MTMTQEMTKGEPVKPVPPALKKLMQLGTIKSIKIEYKQTGTDTADSFVTLGGDGEDIVGLWSSYIEYLNVKVDYCSVAQVKEFYVEQWNGWKTYRKNNEKELAEWKRLKKKYG